jgi:hypothetical protein
MAQGCPCARFVLLLLRTRAVGTSLPGYCHPKRARIDLEYQSRYQWLAYSDFRLQEADQRLFGTLGHVVAHVEVDLDAICLDGVSIYADTGTMDLTRHDGLVTCIAEYFW